MAYTGTYEQELRKNPTDFKLRAMGKRKYQLKQKEKGGKVSVEKIGDANMPGDFGVGKERDIERNNVRSLMRQNLKSEMEKIEKGEPLGDKKQDSKSKDSKRSVNTKGEPKTRKEFGVGTKRVIDESGRKSTSESKGDESKPDSKGDDKEKKQRPLTFTEGVVAGGASTLIISATGKILYKTITGRKARKFAENRTKKNLANLKKTDPSKYQKVMKSVMEKLKNTDARGKTKPDVKKKEANQKNTGKKKNLFQRLKSGALQKIKEKFTSRTGGGRSGAPTGMGTGGTAFGGKDFDGRKKKTIY
tara:strand:- start:1043 stop:1951 length:909 start_codon:yes stop_codon:yes gene_type:complete